MEKGHSLPKSLLNEAAKQLQSPGRGSSLTNDDVCAAVQAGLHVGGNHSAKQAFQRLLQRLELKEDRVYYKNTDLLVAAEDDWPAIVLDAHGDEHLTPELTLKEVSLNKKKERKKERHENIEI